MTTNEINERIHSIRVVIKNVEQLLFDLEKELGATSAQAQAERLKQYLKDNSI